MTRPVKPPEKAESGAMPELIAAIERQRFGPVLTFVLYYSLIKALSPSGRGRIVAIGASIAAVASGIVGVARMKGLL